MRSPTAVVDTRVPGRPRVQLTGCPRCTRPLRLDHAVEVTEDGSYDLSGVAFAQSLHLVNCTG